MKSVLILLFLFACSSASAHKDTDFPIQSNGNLENFPSKYGPANIKLIKTKNAGKSVFLEVQIKNSILKFPPCILSLLSELKIENLSATGSWYHGNWFSRSIGLNLPPYLELRIAIGEQPANAFFHGYSILINMKNAKLIKFTKHIFNEKDHSEKMKNVEISKVCKKDGIEQLSPVYANPTYKNFNGQHTLELSIKMKKALKRHDKDFRSYTFNDFMPTVRASLKPDTRQNFVSVIGDMNGDKVLDVVVSGYNNKNDLLLGIISGEKNYKVIEISKGPKTNLKTNWMVTQAGKKEYGLSDFISYEKPRKIKSPYEKSELLLTNDAFSLNYWQKSSAIYYLKKDKFKPYWISD